jgi:integrase/recombinase XerD
MTAEEYQRVVSVRAVRGFRLAPGRALNQGEVIALLDACAADSSAAGARDAAIIALLLGAGLRRSEAVVLSLSSYDRETQALKVAGKGDKERLAYLDAGRSCSTGLANNARRLAWSAALPGTQRWQG